MTSCGVASASKVVMGRSTVETGRPGMAPGLR